MAMMLARGSSGPEVAALQERLAAAGFPVRVDGDFGGETERALAAFQQAAGLRPDSVYGPKSQAALEVPLPRANPSRAIDVVAAALSGGAGQGASGDVALVPVQQVADRPAPGIGSDPDRNYGDPHDTKTFGRDIEATNFARQMIADQRALRSGYDGPMPTGATLPPPRGLEAMGANSPFDDPSVTAYDPNMRIAPEPAYDPLSSVQVPAQPMSAQQFEDRWSPRPTPQVPQSSVAEQMFSTQAFATPTSMTKEQQRALALAAARRRQAIEQATQAEVTEPYSGSMLPFSKDAQGNVRFDTNAGIIGSIKRAVTLPGDVYSGAVDPSSDEAIARATELATLASPVNPAIRSGEQVLPGAIGALRREKIEPPTAEALKAAGSAGYDAARDMGVQYSSEAVRRLAEDIRFNLTKDGFRVRQAPHTFDILDELSAPPAGSTAPLDGLVSARKSFAKAARNFTSPEDQNAASQAIQQLDSFIAMADPATVVAGPASAAGKTYFEANGNYAAAKRSDQLQGIEDSADLRAAAANSGQNTENAIRQRAVSLLQSPKQIAGYSPAERSAIEAVARGTAAANTLRFVGNLLGGGGGLGAVITGATGGMAGSALGGPAGMVAGALVPAIGLGAKKVASAMARGRLHAADEMVRSRSPLYESMSAGAPISEGSLSGVSAVVRALLASHPEWFGAAPQQPR